MASKSPILMYAKRVLQDIIDRIDNEEDDCSEEMVMQAINKLNAESKGYFNRGSFVNYDEAGRILGIGNRTTLKATLDSHGVKMQRVNNQRVGFLRSEVEGLIGNGGL